MNSAVPDTRTFGRTIPAVVSGGVTCEVRSTGTGPLASAGIDSLTHSATLRDARAADRPTFTTPKPASRHPQTASASGISPIGSLIERGSRSTNEGTVNATVTATAPTSGNTRNAKSRPAARATGYFRHKSHSLRQLQPTARDSPVYTRTNTENETAMPR